MDLQVWAGGQGGSDVHRDGPAPLPCVRLWLEGQDPESSSPRLMGVVSLSLAWNSTIGDSFPSPRRDSCWDQTCLHCSSISACRCGSLSRGGTESEAGAVERREKALSVPSGCPTSFYPPCFSGDLHRLCWGKGGQGGACSISKSLPTTEHSWGGAALTG